MVVRVPFQIGPVPSDTAEAWLANSRKLIAAVRRYRGEVSIEVHDDLLDLCDTLLEIWATHAAKSDDVFLWSTETDTGQVVYLVRQWLEVASLSDDELERLGCSWAPEWTRPFSDALIAGAVAALSAADAEGATLAARLAAGRDDTPSG